MRVLLVEDDALLGEGIATALRNRDIVADWLRDGESALAALRDGTFDVVVLDLGLPKLEGIEVIRRARRAGVRTPILVLSARDQVSDRVRGLDVGADDYLVKPMDLTELVARVRALHRRNAGQLTHRIEHGRIVLDPDSWLVTLDGKIVELPRREFALLKLLLENAGKVVSRERAQQRLYGYGDEVESNALDVYVHQLRRKLYPSLIRTVRGVGFLVDAPA